MKPTIWALVAAVLLAAAPAAHADQRNSKTSKSGTVVKWALIGAAAGGGLGFLLGFKAYDDAPFAERKIGQATAAGAVIGAGGGIAIGILRSRAGASAPSTASSLWTTTMAMKRSVNDPRAVMTTAPRLPNRQLRRIP